MPPRNSPQLPQQPELYSDSSEEIASDLQETKARLLQLRQQMEEYERRERELEELKRRRLEVVNGQKTMREKLTRALTVMERSEHDARRELEQIQHMRQLFSEHLEEIEQIAPQTWEPEELEEGIHRSLTVIDNVRTYYNQSRAKLELLAGQVDSVVPDHEHASVHVDEDSFVELFRRGLAMSLPLVLAIVFLAMVILLQKGA